MSMPLLCGINSSTAQHVENESVSSHYVKPRSSDGERAMFTLIKTVAIDGLLRTPPSAVPRVTSVLGAVCMDVCFNRHRCGNSSSTWASRCFHFHIVQCKVYDRAYGHVLAVNVLLPELGLS